VAFYPVGPLPEDYSGLQAAVLAIFGEEDAFLPIEAAEELATRMAAGTGRRPEIERYPAGHAFVNDENLLGTYEAGLAGQAWDRAVTFLRQALR
jgi:carboxymethylenebutenolidase